MNHKLKTAISWIMVLCLAIIIPSCANLSKMLNQMNIKEPVASVEDAKITGLDFEKIDLIFGIDVKNPNTIGIAMDGFDYDFGEGGGTALA